MNIEPILGKTPLWDTHATTGGGVDRVSGARGGSSIGEVDDFSALLGESIAGVARKLREAEATSIAGIKGLAATQDVVEQVMEAEQVLQASIALRDKVVAAYLEISRMQI